MKRAMIVLLLTLCGFMGCDNGSDGPNPSMQLVGKWKIEKIEFATDLFKVETSLPASYVVAFSMSEDGTLTVTENGQEKKQNWTYDPGAGKLAIGNNGVVENEFEVILSEDGSAWSYKASEINLKGALSAAETELVDFASLVALSSNKNLREASSLKVFFVMKKN